MEQVAGGTLLLVSFVGVVTCSAALFLSLRTVSMRNPFGTLLFNLSICDLISCATFLLCSAPMIIFDIQSLKTSAWPTVFGHIQLLCYDVGNTTHLFGSINRVMAIFFPQHYQNYFTISFARKLNAIAWIITIFADFLVYFAGNCVLTYTDEFWGYDYAQTKYCISAMWYFDFLKAMILIGTTMTLDIITFIKCRTITFKAKRSITETEATKRQRCEIRFVTQSCVQGACFSVEVLAYYFLIDYAESRFGKFLCTMIGWVLVFTMDGLIICLFNRELKTWIRKRVNAVFNIQTNTRDTTSAMYQAERR